MNKEFMYLFKLVFSFSSDKYLAMEFLGVSYFYLGGTSILVSIVAAPIYIPINNTKKFPFLHILDNTCYFLPLPVDCLFFLWVVSFAGQKLFSLIWYHLLIFPFVCLWFWFQMQTVIARTDIKKSAACVFIQEFSDLRSYILVFSPSWINFCEWCKRGIQFFLWHMAVQSSQHLLLKRLALPGHIFLTSLS